MYHSVYSAEINECAVSGHILDLTRVDLTFFNIAPEFLLCGAASLSCLFACNYADRALCSVALDLDDSEAYLVTLDRVEVAVLRNARMISGNKYLGCANKNVYAAVKNFDNLTVKYLACFACFNYFLPLFSVVNGLLGKLRNSVNVAESPNASLDGVTLLVKLCKLYRGVVGNVLGGDDTRNLRAEIKLDLCVGYRGNDACNYISFI